MKGNTGGKGRRDCRRGRAARCERLEGPLTRDHQVHRILRCDQIVGEIGEDRRRSGAGRDGDERRGGEHRQLGRARPGCSCRARPGPVATSGKTDQSGHSGEGAQAGTRLQTRAGHHDSPQRGWRQNRSSQSRKPSSTRRSGRCRGSPPRCRIRCCWPGVIMSRATTSRAIVATNPYPCPSASSHRCHLQLVERRFDPGRRRSSVAQLSNGSVVLPSSTAAAEAPDGRLLRGGGIRSGAPRRRYRANRKAAFE